MAGRGAALLFVPFFYYMGVPLGEAVPTALLLNAVSLSFASVNYFWNKLINWRLGLPILIAAVALSPLGARLARQITEAFPWTSAPAYLVRDNDRAYGHVLTSRVRAMGIGVNLIVGGASLIAMGLHARSGNPASNAALQ